MQRSDKKQSFLDGLRNKRFSSPFLLGALLLAALGLVASALFLFVIVPQQQELALLEQELERERIEVRTVENFLQQHPEPEAYKKQIDAEMQQLQQQIPNAADISGFLKNVNQYAQANGVKITQIKTGATFTIGNYRKLPLEITTNGNYVSNMNFLRQVEAGARFVVIDKSSLTNTAETGLVGNYVLNVYNWQPQNQAQAGQPVQPAPPKK